MKTYRSDSGKDVTYVDYSSSSVLVPSYDSSADPMSLVRLMYKKLFGPSILTPEQEELYLDNTQHHEQEPEDSILVASGLLPRLLAQARQEPPSYEWERDLDEL